SVPATDPAMETNPSPVPVEPDPTTTVFDSGLTLPTAVSTLRVRVVNPDGELLASAPVTAAAKGAKGPPVHKLTAPRDQWMPRATTDSEGWSLLRLAATGLHTISARSRDEDGYLSGSAELIVRTGANPDLHLAVAPPLWDRVRIRVAP